MYNTEMNFVNDPSNMNELQNLKTIIQAAGIGYWCFKTTEPNNIFFDGNGKQLLGILNSSSDSIESAFEMVLAKDKNNLYTAISTTQNNPNIDIKVGIHVPDNETRYVRLIGKASINPADSTIITGIILNATAEKHSNLQNNKQVKNSSEENDNQSITINEQRFRTIFEQAPVAIGVLGGRNMIVEAANNNMLKIWGKTNVIVGLDLIDALPEIRGQHFIELLEDVYDTGIPYFGYATKASLVRNGILEDAYFDFVYTPTRDAKGAVTGAMVLATEVTAQVLAHTKIEESERRFRNLVEEAPVATALMVGRNLKIEVANQMMIDIWGKGTSVIGQKLADALPEIKEQQFLQILDGIFDTGKAYSANNTPAELIVNGKPRIIYFDFTYKPVFNANGEVYGIINMAVDVTAQVTARKKLEESELFAQSIIHNSPVAKMVVIDDAMVINTANKHMLEILGEDAGIIGKPFELALPNLIGTPMMGRLKNVFATGQTFYQSEEKIELTRYGQPYIGYYNMIYKALPNTVGNIYGAIITAVEVTDQVNVRNAFEASENRLRSLVESAPFPIGVYTGREMTIWLANQAIIDVFGKGNDVIGKRYSEILPELENQEIFEQLDQVFTTGIPIHKRNQRVDIVVDGKLNGYYFNYSLTPLFDADGNTYGVMNTAAEITDLVMAKQLVEETEASLRGAVELAELGTWSYDYINHSIIYSERLRDWFGYKPEEIITPENSLELVKEEDRQLLSESLAKAITPWSPNIFDVEYTVVHKVTGNERIIHAQGKAFFNEKGNVEKIIGTAQDVTEQRKLQFALEQEVQWRTEQLAASNERLKIANEALEKSNNRLLHSNEELAQYAYVASHDLQEPLRKIRMFSSMLGKTEMEKADKALIDKIKSSSERMSLLIQDLLEFSRLLNAETLMRPVNISSIVTAVIDDFELSIKEKNAQVVIGQLPTIEAVNLQMNQLFYNLLSNALKFTTPDKPPYISVQAQPITHSEAAKHITKILPFSQYYHITFTDNGIGFEPQYAEQIFEVFKRLHGRDIYPGSGIGLALCRRIVTNHNGYLFVESELNNGTKFHIIFPDKQHRPEPTLPENFNWTAN